MDLRAKFPAVKHLSEEAIEECYEQYLKNTSVGSLIEKYQIGSYTGGFYNAFPPKKHKEKCPHCDVPLVSKRRLQSEPKKTFKPKLYCHQCGHDADARYCQCPGCSSIRNNHAAIKQSAIAKKYDLSLVEPVPLTALTFKQKLMLWAALAAHVDDTTHETSLTFDEHFIFGHLSSTPILSSPELSKSLVQELIKQHILVINPSSPHEAFSNDLNSYQLSQVHLSANIIHQDDETRRASGHETLTALARQLSRLTSRPEMINELDNDVLNAITFLHMDLAASQKTQVRSMYSTLFIDHILNSSRRRVTEGDTHSVWESMFVRRALKFVKLTQLKALTVEGYTNKPEVLTKLWREVHNQPEISVKPDTPMPKQEQPKGNIEANNPTLDSSLYSLSALSPSFAHLSTEQIETLYERYLEHEKVAPLLKEHKVFDVSVSTLISALPPIIHEDALCPHCNIPLVSKRRAKTTKPNEFQPDRRCPKCRHKHDQSCKCKGCKKAEKQAIIDKKRAITERYNLDNFKPVPLVDISLKHQLVLLAFLQSDNQLANNLIEGRFPIFSQERTYHAMIRELIAEKVLLISPTTDPHAFSDDLEIRSIRYSVLVPNVTLKPNQRLSNLDLEIVLSKRLHHLDSSSYGSTLANTQLIDAVKLLYQDIIENQVVNECYKDEYLYDFQYEALDPALTAMLMEAVYYVKLNGVLHAIHSGLEQATRCVDEELTCDSNRFSLENHDARKALLHDKVKGVLSILRKQNSKPRVYRFNRFDDMSVFSTLFMRDIARTTIDELSAYSPLTFCNHKWSKASSTPILPKSKSEPQSTATQAAQKTERTVAPPASKPVLSKLDQAPKVEKQSSTALLTGHLQSANLDFQVAITKERFNLKQFTVIGSLVAVCLQPGMKILIPNTDSMATVSKVTPTGPLNVTITTDYGEFAVMKNDLIMIVMSEEVDPKTDLEREAVANFSYRGFLN